VRPFLPSGKKNASHHIVINHERKNVLYGTKYRDIAEITENLDIFVPCVGTLPRLITT